jgi:hypothetical protein
LEYIHGNQEGKNFWIKHGFYPFEEKMLKEIYRDW